VQGCVLRQRAIDVHYSVPKDNMAEADPNQGTLVVFNMDASVTPQQARASRCCVLLVSAVDSLWASSSCVLAAPSAWALQRSLAGEARVPRVLDWSAAFCAHWHHPPGM
jgi:hypothetical protein